ncbi:MAG: molybdate ABC transporter substrate-binding protein [Wenzhouxiangella sp.]|jgi:molybdate transport system substrate-binding protein|nr:molybdate ABC transporter substrate-binding protein [Wenzhouxiangella sp.]
MSRSYCLFTVAAVCVLGLSGMTARASSADQVTVFAAASMTNALAEIEQRFEETTGHEVVVSLAASSALARQIQQGAPADIYISANPNWMDVLEGDGLVEPGSRFDLLNNAIVLVAHGTGAPVVELGPGLDLVGLLDGGRLAMALVEAVPAGIYGKAALESLGLWSVAAPSVAQADNVRAALALVARGEAPYGIVYATDAVAEDQVSVVATFPAETHPPIVYPAAVMAGRASPLVEQFMTYLRGPEGRAAFERQGFVFIAD